MFNLIRPFRSGQKHCETRRSVLWRDHQLPAIETLQARVLLDAGGLDLGAPALDEPADHGDGISYEVAEMHWTEPSSWMPGHKKGSSRIYERARNLLSFITFRQTGAEPRSPRHRVGLSPSP